MFAHGKSYKILRNFNSAMSGLMKVYFENHTITEDYLLLTHSVLEIKWLLALHYIEEQ